jgi:cobalamin-dependent methionine synthase I
MRWGSVQHYYLGSHYKKGFPDFYKQFSLDSGSDISESMDMAVAAASKTGAYKNKQLRKSEVVQDPDFYEIKEDPRHILERERALEAKFTQNKDMKQVLMESQRAKLIQFKRGKEPIMDESLMKLRKTLL